MKKPEACPGCGAAVDATMDYCVWCALHLQNTPMRREGSLAAASIADRDDYKFPMLLLPVVSIFFAMDVIVTASLAPRTTMAFVFAFLIPLFFCGFLLVFGIGLHALGFYLGGRRRSVGAICCWPVTVLLMLWSLLANTINPAEMQRMIVEAETGFKRARIESDARRQGLAKPPSRSEASEGASGVGDVD